MSSALRTGQRLPYFRLATVGGVSKSRDDFLGRPALYIGWASWDASRELLPGLQKFHDAHRDRLEIVTIAFDVQGPELPMRYLRPAGFTFTALIDACCELSRRWGARQIPFCILSDAAGAIRLVGDAPDETFLAQVPPVLARKSEPKSAPETKIEHPFPRFEILLQSCTNLLGRGRKEEALVALQDALNADPSNFLVRKQMWAIAHPERFYDGPIDLGWQRVQEDATRTLKPTRPPARNEK